MKVFLDSSALVKWYVLEPGSRECIALGREENDIGAFVLCHVEILSTLSRRVRERDLGRAAYGYMKEMALKDLADMTVFDLTADIIDRACQVVEAVPASASDACHIAAALEWGAELFVSADRQQSKAARAAGLRTRAV